MMKIVLIALVALSLVTVSAVYGQVSSDGSTPQHYLRVKSQPGNLMFIGGAGFYNENTAVTLEKMPDTFKDYEFVGWKVDDQWAPGNPPMIVMNRNHEAVAVFQKASIGNVVIDTIPRIAEVTVDGSIYLPDEMPLSFDWEKGSLHELSVKEIVKDSPTKRYKFDSWKDNVSALTRTITVSTDMEDQQKFVAIFKEQVFLKPISEKGIVFGTGWQDAGSTVNFGLESDIVVDKKNENIRYVFDSWSQGYYPNSAQNSIDVDGQKTIQANWREQYHLQLRTNIPDYDLFGTGWYEKGSQVALIAEESLESEDANIKYVFDKWVSKGPNPVIIPNSHSASTTITVDKPYIIEAHYKKSYRVNVWTPFGSAIGSGFYDEGSTAELRMQETQVVTQPNKERKIFAGWETNGARTMTPETATVDSLDSAAANQNLMVVVDQPLSITTKWKTQYYLDVVSAEGGVDGEGWYDVGRVAQLQVKEPSKPPGMWSAVAFEGWSGDITSEKMRDRIIMNEPKTVVAEWTQDSSPGIINGIVLAGAAAGGGLIYFKTRKSGLVRGMKKDMYKPETEPFSGFENNPLEMDQQFHIPRKAKGKSVMDWLMGRN